MDINLTIDIERIKLMADNSVKDPETIRQISIYDVQNPVEKTF